MFDHLLNQFLPTRKKSGRVIATQQIVAVLQFRIEPVHALYEIETDVKFTGRIPDGDQTCFETANLHRIKGAIKIENGVEKGRPANSSIRPQLSNQLSQGIG